MSHAWIIDRDHLHEEYGDGPNSVGVTGPRTAPDALTDALQRNDALPALLPNGWAVDAFTFKLYDDDDELYYTGRMVMTKGSDFEAACYSPLGDFGGPGAGCTSVRYPRHPEMDCG